MKKLIDFKDLALYLKIQRFADDKFEGNFSMAVRFLVGKGLKGEDKS